MRPWWTSALVTRMKGARLQRIPTEMRAAVGTLVTAFSLPFLAIGFVAHLVTRATVAGWRLGEDLIDWM